MLPLLKPFITCSESAINRITLSPWNTCSKEKHSFPDVDGFFPKR